MNDVARFCSGCGTPTANASAYAANPAPQQQPQQANYRPLVRVREGKWLGGVCTGLARYWGTDPALVRIIFVALGLCPVLPAIVPYIVCWIVIPYEPEPVARFYAPPAASGGPVTTAPSTL